MSDKKLYVIGGRPRTGKSIIAGRVKARRGSVEILCTDRFRPNGNDELAWQNIVNRLNLPSFATDVLIEGVAITPSKLHSLKLDNVTLETAVFLGFSRSAHADTILRHAREAKEKDWVFPELQKDPGYENVVRGWMEEGIAISAQLKRETAQFGYGYFDITDYQEFEAYAVAVISYLLKISRSQ